MIRVETHDIFSALQREVLVRQARSHPLRHLPLSRRVSRRPLSKPRRSLSTAAGALRHAPTNVKCSFPSLPVPSPHPPTRRGDLPAPASIRRARISSLLQYVRLL